jgi:hypothetical protein
MALGVKAYKDSGNGKIRYGGLTIFYGASKKSQTQPERISMHRLWHRHWRLHCD